MLASGWQDLIGTTVAQRYLLRNLVSASSLQAEFTGVSNDENSTPVSVALIEVEAGEAESELAAVNRAKELQHPNLLRVMDGGEFTVQDSHVLFIVTEPAHGTLAEASQPDLRELLDDVLTALEGLHSKNLVYRNLDAETVVRAGDHDTCLGTMLVQVGAETGVEGDFAVIFRGMKEP